MTLVSNLECSPTERSRRHDCTRLVSIKTRSGGRIFMVPAEATSELDWDLRGILRGQAEEGLFQSAIDPASPPQFVPRADRDHLSVMHDPDAIGHLLRDAELMRGNENRHAAQGS